MDAKALVIHEHIDLIMDTLGFEFKGKNQVLACVVTWTMEGGMGMQ